MALIADPGKRVSEKQVNSLLSLSGLWRKRYTVLNVSCKLNRCKIVNACKNRFHRSRIIDFPEESGQGQVFEIDTSLSVSVPGIKIEFNDICYCNCSYIKA